MPRFRRPGEKRIPAKDTESRQVERIHWRIELQDEHGGWHPIQDRIYMVLVEWDNGIMVCNVKEPQTAGPNAMPLTPAEGGAVRVIDPRDGQTFVATLRQVVAVPTRRPDGGGYDRHFFLSAKRNSTLILPGQG